MPLRAIAAVALPLAASAPAAHAQVAYVNMRADGRDIRTTQVAPGIYQFTIARDGYVRQLNVDAIVTDRDVVMFDSATRPSSAAMIVAMLRKITRNPVRIVINSHAHPDHWSGTQAFADAFPGLEVIASAQTDRFMHLMAPVWPVRLAEQARQQREALEKEQASGTTADGGVVTPQRLAQDRNDATDAASLADEMRTLRRVYPTRVYRRALNFRHSGLTFALTAMTGDQDGTSVLYLPARRVLFTGDLVSYPLPFISAHPSRQLASLRAIDALPFAVLVPGHGPAFRDHAYVRLEIALLQAALDGVKRQIAAGNGELAAIQAKVTLDALRSRFTGGDPDLEARYTARVRDLVRFAFQETTGTG